MKRLRQTVERGREAYQAVRYPGDLAAEVLGRRRHWVWVLPLGGLAAAAMVAVALWPHRPVATPPPPEPVATAAPSHQMVDGPLTAPGMPELPSGIELMPQYQALSPQLGALSLPSYPGFGSMDFERTESTATTQEAV